MSALQHAFYSSIDVNFPEGANFLLEIRGIVPQWIVGSLYRVGPGRYEVTPGGRRLEHLFDGYALVQKVTFESGRVVFRSRMLQSERYESAVLAGAPVGSEFGTPAPFFSRIRNLFSGGLAMVRPTLLKVRVLGQHHLFCYADG